MPPAAKPTRSPMSMQRIGFTPATASFATIHPDIARTEPTEISIPLVMMGSMMPRPISP